MPSISCSACTSYAGSIVFIEFFMDFCIYNDILDTIWITDKSLLHFKFSKSGQILRVDKSSFPGSHIYIFLSQCMGGSKKATG